MTIKLTIEPQGEKKESIQADRIFGVAYKKQSEAVTEASVFCVGSMSRKDILLAVENISAVATMILLKEGVPSEFVQIKVAEAVAEGVGGALKAAEAAQAEMSDMHSILKTAIEKPDQLEKTLRKLTEAKKLLDVLEAVKQAQTGSQEKTQEAQDIDAMFADLAEKLLKRQRG